MKSAFDRLQAAALDLRRETGTAKNGGKD